MTVKRMPEQDNWVVVWTTPSIEKRGEISKSVIAIFLTELDAQDFADMKNANEPSTERFDVMKESEISRF